MISRIIFSIQLIFVCSGVFGQTSSENLFYMVNSPSSFESFKANVDQISIVSPQTFLISENGVISGSLDPRVLEIAKNNKIKVMPLIVNKGFDRKLLHDIVSNPVARKRSIEMMIEYANRYGLAGWQFDLEGLHISDKDDFTLYFKETADAFHKVGLKLSAALVHSTDVVGGPSEYHRFLFESWRAGYSLKELAQAGDFLSIMTYDQHTRRTPPGPVAGIDWVEKVVGHLLSEGVPAEKLSLGIPSYSVHWFADYTPERGGFSNGRQIRYDMVEHLIGRFEPVIKWNEQSQCNYAVWSNAGTYEYLFIENGKSLKPKLDLLKKYNLRGISVWSLGGEAPDFWSTLKKGTKKL